MFTHRRRSAFSPEAIISWVTYLTAVAGTIWLTVLLVSVLVAASAL